MALYAIVFAIGIVLGAMAGHALHRRAVGVAIRRGVEELDREGERIRAEVDRTVERLNASKAEREARGSVTYP